MFFSSALGMSIDVDIETNEKSRFVDGIAIKAVQPLKCSKASRCTLSGIYKLHRNLNTSTFEVTNLMNTFVHQEFDLNWISKFGNIGSLV